MPEAPASLLSPDNQELFDGLGWLSDWVGYPDVLTVPGNNVLAKQHWLLGLKLLHAFWFDLSATHFRLAQTLEPTFAMAYWGEYRTVLPGLQLPCSYRHMHCL